MDKVIKRYELIVYDNIKNILKHGFIYKSTQFIKKGIPAVRKTSEEPILINGNEMIKILKALHSPYSAYDGGYRGLSNTIRIFGGFTIPERQVDFNIKIRKITKVNGYEKVKSKELLEFNVRGHEEKVVKHFVTMVPHCQITSDRRSQRYLDRYKKLM